MTKKIWLEFWPILILLVLVLLYFLRLFYPTLSVFVTPDFGGSDLLHFNYPVREFLAQSLKKGQLPLWTTLLGTGFPLFAEGQIGSLFLLNWITSLASSLALNLNFSYLFYFALIAVFTYLFALELNLGKWGSLLASLVFTFSGVNLTHLSHINQLAVTALLPLQFYLLERFIKKSTVAFQSQEKVKFGWLLLFSLVTSQSILAGYLQISVYILIALTVYFVLRLFSVAAMNLGKKGKLLLLINPLGWFIGSLLLSLGLSLVQLLPSWELAELSLRGGGLPGEILSLYPYPPQHLLTFLNPNWFGTPVDGTYPKYGEDWGIYWENTAYVGIVPLFLGLVVVIRVLRALGWFLFSKLQSFGETNGYKQKMQDMAKGEKSYAVIFVVLLSLSLVLALGKYTPFFLFYHLPPLSYFRVPARWLLMVDFSLAILAGLGFLQIQQILKKYFVEKDTTKQWRGKVHRGFTKTRLIYLPVIVFLLTWFDLWFYFFNFNPIGKFSEWIKNPPQLVNVLKRDSSDFRIYELGNAYVWNLVFTKNGWQGELDKYLRLREGLRPSLTLLYDIPHAGVYTGFFLHRTSELLYMTDDAFKVNERGEVLVTDQAIRLLSLQHVKYLISPFALVHSDLKLITSTDFGGTYTNFFVYQNEKVLTRVFLVNNFRLARIGENTINNLSLVKQSLNDPGFDPQKEVILEENPNYFKEGTLEESRVDFVKNAQQEIEVEVKLPKGNGLLVLADTYYPGWKATLDGKSTPILAANLNQRAVVVPQGEHRIRFIYQPKSFKIGSIISIGSFLFWSLALFYPCLHGKAKSSL